MEAVTALIAAAVPLVVAVTVAAVEVVIVLGSKRRRRRYADEIRVVGLAATLRRVLKEEPSMSTEPSWHVEIMPTAFILPMSNSANRSRTADTPDGTKYVTAMTIVQAPQVQDGRQPVKR